MKAYVTNTSQWAERVTRYEFLRLPGAAKILGTYVGVVGGPIRRCMAGHRIYANASFRLPESDVTHETV